MWNRQQSARWEALGYLFIRWVQWPWQKWTQSALSANKSAKFIHSQTPSLPLAALALEVSMMSLKTNIDWLIINRALKTKTVNNISWQKKRERSFLILCDVKVLEEQFNWMMERKKKFATGDVLLKGESFASYETKMVTNKSLFHQTKSVLVESAGCFSPH